MLVLFYLYISVVPSVPYFINFDYYHANVVPVHAGDLEVIQKLDASLPERISLVTFADLKIDTKL